MHLLNIGTQGGTTNRRHKSIAKGLFTIGKRIFTKTCISHSVSIRIDQFKKYVSHDDSGNDWVHSYNPSRKPYLGVFIGLKWKKMCFQADFFRGKWVYGAP